MHHVARRPVILTFNKTFLPGYKGGGPIRTIANMVDSLGDRIDFRIVTLDRDDHDTEPYRGMVPETWTSLGKGSVYYVNVTRVSPSLIASLVADVAPDAVYANSFFDRVFTNRLLVARATRVIPPLPTILAPRGEFSSGALRYKSWRKWAYVRAFRALYPVTSVVWHASTTLEKADLLRVMPGVREDMVRVACDLAAMPPAPDESAWHDGYGPLRVLFLSRVTPMKNLVFVLETLARVRVPVRLSIVGPRDDDYWRECQQHLHRLPPNVEVDVRDAVSPSEVISEMQRHDLFFLPTQGENFGHVIHEALCAGLPVLISDRTAWNGVGEAGAGWPLPLDSHAPFVAAIERYAATPAPDRLAMRRTAAAYARSNRLSAAAYDDNLRLFTDVVANGVGSEP